MKSRPTLLGSAALISLASPALAQSTPPPPDASAQPAATTAQQPATPATAQSDTGAAQAADQDYGDEEPIVIQGGASARLGGWRHTAAEHPRLRDIRATGATSISDLLDAIAPQIGSSQGRGGEQPVLLLNGQRISSFRELRDIPPEAIDGSNPPEEVALKYGYRADQKVVNIVLRQRFRSTTAQVGAGLSTDGGYANGNADLTKFMIEKNGRTTLNLHAEGNSLLTEDERNIILQETPPTGATTDDLLEARSLLPSKRDLRASGTFNRQLFGDVSGTLNTEVEHTDSRALVGFGDTLLEALARNTDTNTAHAESPEWHQVELALDADEQCRSRSHHYEHRSGRTAQRPRARDHGIRRHQGDRERQSVQASSRRCELDDHSWRNDHSPQQRAPHFRIEQFDLAWPNHGRGGDQPRPADLTP